MDRRKNLHTRTDNIVEFARGDILYKVGENGYSADVIIGIKRNGTALLYDIVNIYDKKITEDTLTKENNNVILRREISSVDGSIPQSTSESQAKKSTRNARYLELAKDPEKNRAELQSMVDEAAQEQIFRDTNKKSRRHGEKS